MTNLNDKSEIKLETHYTGLINLYVDANESNIIILYRLYKESFTSWKLYCINSVNNLTHADYNYDNVIVETVPTI